MLLMQKSRRNLTLGETALIDLITSSVEVYKKETFGLLLGKKHKKHYMVYDVVNFLSAKRGYEFVHVSPLRINRVDYVLSNLTNLRVIGDFHSHPDSPDKLSGADKIDVKKSGLSLTTLVIVKKAKRRYHNWEIRDNSIVGFIGNRYHIKIMAFEYDKKLDKLFQIKIICPCLKKLNKLKVFYKK